MLNIPSTIFDKKNLSSSRTETKRGRKKKKNYPVYSVQYLAKNNHKGTWPNTYSKTCRDHGPRLSAKERKTMPKKKKLQ